MRRKAGTLLPLEIAILEAAIALRVRGARDFHGYLIASTVKVRGESKSLTAHGTLYKALERMQTGGLLESRWEDPAIAATAERPRRRLYEVTTAGEAALARANAEAAQRAVVAGGGLAPGLSPS